MLHHVLPLLALLWAVEGVVHCKPGERACWPSDADIAALISELDPTAPRFLAWRGAPHPRPSAFPAHSIWDQPLYALGTYDSLKPLYVRNASDLEHTCFAPVGLGKYFDPEFCKASVRNNPLLDWSPAFVAWPLTAAHVQTVVRFAVKHKLCISVAGTGHDFNNRHSCPDGMFIRTSLMKEIDWDLDDSRGYGWSHGNVRFGPGIVFDEAHHSAAKNNRVVASGWAATVGVVGWSIGGGHGPLCPSLGLGADNILSADVVLADGSLVTASANSHSDIYFALRGGGGSTWGVITSITLRAHPIPEGGITISTTAWSGSGDAQRFYDINAAYVDWSKTLDSRWGMVSAFGTTSKNIWGRVQWVVMLSMVYAGSNTSTAFIDTLAEIEKQPGSTTWGSTYANYADAMVGGLPSPDPIIPYPYLAASDKSAGGLGSALVRRENATLTTEVLKKVWDTCQHGGACNRLEYFQDITGNRGSPQADNVAISPAFRNALYHLVFGSPTEKETQDIWSMLGSDNAYFAESSYQLPNSARAYWGDNLPRLQRIKNKYDSGNVFGCHNCIAGQDG